eukprot:57133_1
MYDVVCIYTAFFVSSCYSAERCIIVYDDMDDAVSTEWTFSNEAIYESFGWSQCKGSDICIQLQGHNPVMSRTFSNINSYALTNIQIKYYVYAIRRYLIQYKWSDNEWIDLWYGDYSVGPINYIHNLQDAPLGDVSLSIRFQWFPYCNLGYCDCCPQIWIDNFYLMAATSPCPTEEPTTTTIPPCVIMYDNMDNYPYPGWIFSTEAMVETYTYGKLN